MSEPKSSNIVPMGAYERDRSGISEADRSLLNQCRERALKALKDSLSDMFDSADDMLFEMADKAENNTKQTLYFDAMREIRLAREATETEYLAQLKKSFEQSAGKEMTATQGRMETPPDGLSLLGQEQLEEDLAITNMVTKARNSVHSALFALDRRIGVLLHEPQLDSERNPLSPDAICAAFRQASKKIDTSLEVRLLILKLYDQYLDRDLPMVYADINDFLIGRSILPVIEEDYKSISTVRRQRQKPQQDPHLESTGSRPGVSAQSDVNADFTRLLQLLGNSLATGSGLPAVGNTAQVIADLDTLQHQQLALPLQAFPDQQGTATAGMAGQSVLHTIRAQGLVSGMSQADDQTLDLVAILFDYILDDKDIPDPMKALIGRLQIPLLKVAILDKSVFSHKDHPARRLLNTLSSAALGWNAEDHDGDALYACIEELVQRINREFVEDITLFDTVENELGEFLAQQRRQADLRADRAAKVLQGQERLKLATLAAEEIIGEVLEDAEVEDFISRFLCRHIQEHLRVLHVRKGPESADWAQAVELCRDLVWSCQQKAAATERKALIDMLPGLIKSLNACMDATGMEGRERQRFLEQLADVHSQRVRPPQIQDETTLPPREDPGAGSEAEIVPAPADTAEEYAAPQRSQEAEARLRDPAIDTEPSSPPPYMEADYVDDAIRELRADDLPALETGIEVSFESSVSREELLALFGTDQVDLEEITIENEARDEDSAPSPAGAIATATGGSMTPPPPEAMDTEEAAYLEQVRALSVGDWLEFSLLGGKARRVRLTWISQSTGIYLFTDRQGRKAAEKTEQGMVVEFRRGSVRLLESAPLFDRALSGLMERLSGKAQRAPRIS